MKKNVAYFLLAGMIGFFIGNASVTIAEEKKEDKSSKEVLAKLDQVLKNQEEMKGTLKKIWART